MGTKAKPSTKRLFNIMTAVRHMEKGGRIYCFLVMYNTKINHFHCLKQRDEIDDFSSPFFLNERI